IYIPVMQSENKDANPVKAFLLAAKLHNFRTAIVFEGKPTLLETVGAIKLQDDQEFECNKRNTTFRGLRNRNDLQYEMNNQYWNEDIGIQIPFVYFITDRRLAHVSSSAIRGIKKLGLHHDY